MVAVSRFVVQLHDATRLHFDFRLQSGEVLRSWAVPKGPSLDPGIRRLAVPVDDHPMSAGDFEGVHAGQARGTGAVIIWDEGTAEVLHDEPGHHVLLVRGRADIEFVDDVTPEYALAATRYFGPEQGPAWVSSLRGTPSARIAITPDWVGILDFQTRFPSALAQ